MTKYWVNGSGNWTDPNHWSETSGGIGGAGVPTAEDDVVFDENSGEGVCMIDTGYNACVKTIDWLRYRGIITTENPGSSLTIVGTFGRRIPRCEICGQEIEHPELCDVCWKMQYEEKICECGRRE